ncbi:MAG: hypothetical protein J6D87_01535 [Clostridia bacterium]|nr:hypothetical protein [Clostridia bacterium]
MFYVTDTVSAWVPVSQLLERRFRVDACPILSVRAEYSQLVSATAEDDGIRMTDAAAQAFNSFYQNAAERFVTAGIERFSYTLRCVYEGLSPAEARCFARRELECRMLLGRQETENREMYAVVVERFSGIRRSDIRVLRQICKHLWRFPEGILQKQILIGS